jgi:hypothetical protein
MRMMRCEAAIIALCPQACGYVRLFGDGLLQAVRGEPVEPRSLGFLAPFAVSLSNPVLSRSIISSA